MQAVRAAGVDVPTLCTRGERRPLSSCYLCAVHIEGHGALQPACAARAEDGQVVTTHSDEVQRHRRVTLEMLFSEHAGDCEAPCTLACPAHVDIPAMLREIQRGDMQGAAAVLTARIASPESVCGSCSAPCEKACRRKSCDEAVAIQDLIAFLVESGHTGRAAATASPAAQKTDVPERGAPVGFNCSLGRLRGGEKAALLAGASGGPRSTFDTTRTPRCSREDAAAEGKRCLRCDCRKAATCRLRRAADELNLPHPRNAASRPDVEIVRTDIGIVFEPGKCIQCGRCIEITETDGEPVGLTWSGRGFSVRISPPPGASWREALQHTADACVKACPTAALAYE